MYDARNASRYLRVTSCRKVLIVDPHDEIIPDLASLRSGAALGLLFGDPEGASFKTLAGGTRSGGAISGGSGNTIGSSHISGRGGVEVVNSISKKTLQMMNNSEDSNYDIKGRGGGGSREFDVVSTATGGSATIDSSSLVADESDVASVASSSAPLVHNTTSSTTSTSGVEQLDSSSSPIDVDDFEGEAEFQRNAKTFVSDYHWLFRLVDLIYKAPPRDGGGHQSMTSATVFGGRRLEPFAGDSGANAENTTGASGAASWSELATELAFGETDVAWLEKHKGFVRRLFVSSALLPQVRSTLDLLSREFNIGGSSINDVLSLADYGKYVDYEQNLRQFLANMVCWGPLPQTDGFLSQLETSGSAASLSAMDIAAVEWFTYGYQGNSRMFKERLQRPSMNVVQQYHRALALPYLQRARRIVLEATSRVLQERSASTLAAATLEAGAVEDASAVPSRLGNQGKGGASPPLSPSSATTAINGAICARLKRLDLFFSMAARFHLRMSKHTQTEDFARRLGYVVHVDCGHNGALAPCDQEHLALYFADLYDKRA
ncbi:unnamed protein product [Amoebophrya sp. A25]|nr:unnamed protein product [Amoebophrya sp. A25]|eukprot:GSA25T00026914001.1